MKKATYIYVIFFLILANACNEDLTKIPDFISEDAVFEQRELTEAYLANLYEDAVFLNIGAASNYEIGLIPAIGAEHINFANWQSPNQTYLRTYSPSSGNGPMEYWPYEDIREMNYLLEEIVKSETLEKEYIDQVIAEVRWLRVFTYFEMVKRFGAVPLILRPQSLDDPEEELYPPRTSEKDMYDFMIKELEDVIPILTSDLTGVAGRIDKWTAMGLLSRISLYAASIANFGKVEGDVGIDPGSASSYYQKAYNISKAIIDSGHFQLYKQLEDPELNYRQLFLDEGNSEVIFAEVFEPFIKGTSFDNLAFPADFGASWNSNYPVLYDFVEMFDFVDGRKGTSIDRGDFNNNTYWDIKDFFGNRDPRFRASVFYAESEFQGDLVYFHARTAYTENGEEKVATSGFLERNGEVWPASCNPRHARNTAMLRRKYVNESDLDPMSNESGQDFIVLRLGEILLNFAEAAFYLDKSEEALEAVNQIRERAGMPLYTELSEEELRQERQVELCFENHRFWDLLRWRNAQQYLDQVRTKGFNMTYDLDKDRYIILLKNAETADRTFGEERYYFPIPQGRIADNPKISQNPGYE